MWIRHEVLGNGTWSPWSPMVTRGSVRAQYTNSSGLLQPSAPRSGRDQVRFFTTRPAPGAPVVSRPGAFVSPENGFVSPGRHQVGTRLVE